MTTPLSTVTSTHRLLEPGLKPLQQLPAPILNETAPSVPIPSVVFERGSLPEMGAPTPKQTTPSLAAPLAQAQNPETLVGQSQQQQAKTPPVPSPTVAAEQVLATAIDRTSAVAGLTPKLFWSGFAAISQIPRGSGNEKAIADYISSLATARGLEVRRDTIGNVVVVVPATPGCEKAPATVVQAHMDMVCEKCPNVQHDFTKDGITLVRKGDWLYANGTTLGADDGAGVAACLALLDDKDAVHGPLQLLFTVDEETGLTGATNIGDHMINAPYLLNVDEEKHGQVTVGCAGGVSHHLKMQGVREPVDMSSVTYGTLNLAQAIGGHSGVDIHLGRINALVELGSLLGKLDAAAGGDLRLVSMAGGKALNAIPRDGEVVFCVPRDSVAAVYEVFTAEAASVRAAHAKTDPNSSLNLAWTPSSTFEQNAAPSPFTAADTQRFIALLSRLPLGPLSWVKGSKDPLVQTSSNVGKISTEGDTLVIGMSCRSSEKTDLKQLAAKINVLATQHQASMDSEGDYPGWSPSFDSPLLRLFCASYKRLFGAEPKVQSIHAGLECGVLSDRFPDMQMIAFGPTMEGNHSPDEHFYIPSVAPFYDLLKNTLQDIAAAPGH